MFNKFITSAFRLSLAMALFAGLILVGPRPSAQETASAQPAKTEIAGTKKSASFTPGDVKATPVVAPLWRDYKGVRIGMNAAEVRDTLDHLKAGGDSQDFFVFSDTESAQVFYDAEGKVRAVSVTYAGNDSDRPLPTTVFGEEIQANADGSIYKMGRYPEAGYWVSYSRTAGDSQIVTVTMQKIP